MVNLVNVYDMLLKSYGDRYTITYALPPTYMSEILGPENTRNKIIFFYKEDRSAGVGEVIVNRTQGKTERIKTEIKSEPKEENLDLTGSPLKDDYLLNTLKDVALDDVVEETRNCLTFEEQHHCGINANEAREIICSEEFQSRTFTDQNGSVWVLCNGGPIKEMLLEYEFKNGYFSRGIVCFGGMVPADTVNYQSLLKCYIPITANANSQYESFVENIYHIKKNITLCCTYSSNSTLSVLNDLSNCDITLRQLFRASESNDLAQDFFNQLRLLNYIREDIISYHKSIAAGYPNEPVYRCGCGIEMEELRASIHKVITEVGTTVEPDTDLPAKFKLEDILRKAGDRCLLELTDKLWNIMKCCATYNELKLAFNMLFQCTLRYNIVNVPTNKNRLAEIITELANHRLAVPCLSGVEPLELLFEIGIEKITKDYEYIFTNGRICSVNLLKYNPPKVDASTDESSPEANIRKSLHSLALADVVAARKTLRQYNAIPANKSQDEIVPGFKNSNFDEDVSGAQIAKLLQIHCTLEHLLLLETNFNQNSLHGYVSEYLLRQEPPPVDNIDEHYTDLMTIKIEPHFIRDHLDGKDPYTRRISISTSEGQTTYFFTVNNMLPSKLAQNLLPAVAEQKISQSMLYYSYIYRKWTTPVC